MRNVRNVIIKLSYLGSGFKFWGIAKNNFFRNRFYGDLLSTDNSFFSNSDFSSNS